MNRTIKFRAWDGDKMQEVNSLTWTRHFGIKVNFDGAWDNLSANEWEVMQFTGLLDKNGKEIYEGDIVQVFYAGSEQTENDKAYTVTFNDIRDGYSGVGEGKGEVIGNVWEHPNLLDV